MYTKHLSLLSVAVVCLLWAGAMAGQAQVSTAVTYQGRLTDAGEPVNDTADLDFLLFDAETEGEVVGMYKTFGTPVVDGLFNVELDFGEGVFQGEARWLEITVHLKSGEDWITLSPRQPIRPAPYALYALDGAGGGGGSLWTVDPNDGISYQAGNVGIGASSITNVRLRVDSAEIYTVNARNRTTSGSSYAVLAEGDSTSARAACGLATATSGEAVGVYGSSQSPAGYGVWGSNNSTATSPRPVGAYGTAASSHGVGVKGYTDGSSGVAVWGRADGVSSHAMMAEAIASSGTTFGLEAYACSPDGYGVYSYNDAGSGDAIAILGETASSAGVGVKGLAFAPDGYGVYGYNGHSAGDAVGGYFRTGSTQGCGVYAEAASASSGYAGYFVGRGYFSNNVGIGTAAPGSPLTVAGLIESTSGGFKFPDGTIQTTAGGGGGGDSVWQQTGSDIYYTAGDVGIGTTTPQHPLHVVSNAWRSVSIRTTATGGSAVYGEALSVSGATHGIEGYVASPSGSAVYGFNEADSGNAIAVLGETTSPDGVGVKGTSDWGGIGVLGWADGAAGRGVVGQAGDPNGFAGYFLGRGYFSGNVGIGTESPESPLHVIATDVRPAVIGRDATHNTAGYLGDSSEGVYGEGPTGVMGAGDYVGIEGTGDDKGVYGWGADYGVYGDGAHGVYGYSDEWVGVGVEGHAAGEYGQGVTGLAEGAEGIGVYAEASGASGTAIEARGAAAAAKLYGRVNIYEYGTNILVIELGKGLDYAEGFDVSNETSITPGTVLVIDSANPGQLAVSTRPYDHKVAGIVAGANGLGSGVRLGGSEFDHDVALAGRVYCNVLAVDQPIEPGDLLTTSDVPGYAMKVADHERAQGAILGKAMQRLEKGERGQILVLVTLQ